MDQDTKDILETVILIKENMATKDDVREIAREVTREVIREEVPRMIDEKLKPIIDELQSIRRDLDELKTKVDNLSGLTKEIDHALERIAAIEKHLGIQPKTAV